ncbi:MAG: hypothetical protein RIC38_01195, partial [Chromatocurvus sp.]
LFGPVGEGGYPRHLWNRDTGVIDPEVAQYWRENYDLRYNQMYVPLILKRIEAAAPPGADTKSWRY